MRRRTAGILTMLSATIGVVIGLAGFWANALVGISYEMGLAIGVTAMPFLVFSVVLLVAWLDSSMTDRP